MMDDKDYGKIADALAWNEVRKDAIEKARGAKSSERFYVLIYWLGTMSEVVEKEGLLALEKEAAKVPSEIGLYKEIQWVPSLITEGITPDILLERAVARYWASNLQGEDALLYYMNVWGFLRIQVGEEWGPVIEWLLLTHLPLGMDEWYEEYKAYKKRMDEPKLAERRERFMNAAPAFEVQWTLKKLLEDKIEQAEDRRIQRVLRDTDNTDLSIAFLGMSIAAKQKILSNLSERLVNLLARDWEEMEDVSHREVVEAYVAILHIFEVVEKMGEY